MRMAVIRIDICHHNHVIIKPKCTWITHTDKLYQPILHILCHLSCFEAALWHTIQTFHRCCFFVVCCRFNTNVHISVFFRVYDSQRVYVVGIKWAWGGKPRCGANVLWHGIHSDDDNQLS